MRAVRSKNNKFLQGYIRTLGFVLKAQEEVAAERVFPHLSQRYFTDVNSQNIALDEEGKKAKIQKWDHKKPRNNQEMCVSTD